MMMFDTLQNFSSGDKNHFRKQKTQTSTPTPKTPSNWWHWKGLDSLHIHSVQVPQPLESILIKQCKRPERRPTSSIHVNESPDSKYWRIRKHFCKASASHAWSNHCHRARRAPEISQAKNSPPISCLKKKKRGHGWGSNCLGISRPQVLLLIILPSAQYLWNARRD